MATKKSICVYTVMAGGYEVLNEQPMAHESGVPFICLTDDTDLSSASWKTVPVPHAFKMDPIRSQRILKICPHLCDALSEFDHSLYIDNSVILLETPEKIIDRYGWGQGLSLPTHSFRESVLDEFIEVARQGYDDQHRIYEQLNHYLTYGETTLYERPFWTAILLRNHSSPRIRKSMELWAAHVLRYSRRDQLSINLALRDSDVSPERWNIDNKESWFHSWPHTPQRKHLRGVRNPLTSITPPHVQIHQLQQELASARNTSEQTGAELDIARREADGLADSLGARVRHMGEMEKQLAATSDSMSEMEKQHQITSDILARSELELDQLRGEKQHLQAVSSALYASTSWRMTAPLRRLKRWMT